MLMRALFVVLLLAALVVPASADPAGNQLVSWSALCTGISEGALTALSGTPSQCTSSPHRIVRWSDVVGAISTSGCATGNPLPTWSEILGCRVTGGTGTFTSESFTFSAAAYTALSHPVAGGSPTITCEGPSAPVLTFTLPSSTKAPTTSSTQLSWKPTSENEGYTVHFEPPSGGTGGTSYPIAAGSTATVYYSGSPTAGAWEITVTGLTSNSCSNGTLSGTSGVATGTAGWYD